MWSHILCPGLKLGCDNNDSVAFSFSFKINEPLIMSQPIKDDLVFFSFKCGNVCMLHSQNCIWSHFYQIRVIFGHVWWIFNWSGIYLVRYLSDQSFIWSHYYLIIFLFGPVSSVSKNRVRFSSVNPWFVCTLHRGSLQTMATCLFLKGNRI